MYLHKKVLDIVLSGIHFSIDGRFKQADAGATTNIAEV